MRTQTVSSYLKPEHIDSYGNTDIPHVLNVAFSKIAFKYYSAPNIFVGECYLCSECSKTLQYDYEKQVNRKTIVETHYNGHFKKHYSEEKILYGSYYKKEPTIIDECMCCKVSTFTGNIYHVNVYEIATSPASLKIFNVHDILRVVGTNIVGKCVLIEDSREEYSRYTIQLIDNYKRITFLNWQLEKIN